jgi:hypothetical protein
LEVIVASLVYALQQTRRTASLLSCDQLFRLLLSYLKALNVKAASKVLFIADDREETITGPNDMAELL